MRSTLAGRAEAAGAGYLAACLLVIASLSRWSIALHRAVLQRSGNPTRGHRRDGAESGMSTAEYAVGTLAACTFAALLIAIIRSPAIRSTLTGLITSALQLGR